MKFLDFIPSWVWAAGTVALAAMLVVLKLQLGAEQVTSANLRTEVSNKNTEIERMNKQAAQDALDNAAAVLAAQNEGRRREQIAKDNAAAAAYDADGLRDVVQGLESVLETAAADAVREYASTAGGLLTVCTKEYQGMAAKAQGHYNDTLTLQQAWPKK